MGIAEVCCILLGLGLVGSLAYGTYTMAVPAFFELYAAGGGSNGDLCRNQFNLFLRHVTSWVEFFTLLITGGLAAVTVTNECARNLAELDRHAALGP